MIVEVTIDKVKEAKFKRLIAQLSPERVARRIAPVCKQVWVDHLAEKPQNKMGWKTTKFWERAARSIKYKVEPDGFLLSAHHLGMRQRYYGGEIKPVNKKWLTIPARSEAYGKTAGQFKDLHFVVLPVGGPALARVEKQAVSFGRKRKDGSRKVKIGEVSGGEVMFWLRKKVTQSADPTVIPPQSRFLEAIKKSIASIQP